MQQNIDEHANQLYSEPQADMFDRSGMEESDIKGKLDDEEIIEPIDLEKMTKHGVNWSLLFFHRLTNKDTVKKYRDNKIRYTPDPEKRASLDIDEITRDYYRRIGYSFTETQIGSSNEYGSQSFNHGAGMHANGFGGAVFADAKTIETSKKVDNADNGSNDMPLDTYAKMIVEAHEKSHGILDTLYPLEQTVIEDAFDFYQFRNGEAAGYPIKDVPYELLARMTQLKDYFGFKGVEKFTKCHLDYAREHYIKDTKYDNNMTDFFRAIPPDKEKKFIALMNNFVC